MGILYWGAGLEGQGWDLLGRGPGGFPRIDRNSDALVDSWKGRMENAQVTLRMCASEGPGFKRYVKHFLMLSAQACVLAVTFTIGYHDDSFAVFCFVFYQVSGSR